MYYHKPIKINHSRIGGCILWEKASPGKRSAAGPAAPANLCPPPCLTPRRCRRHSVYWKQFPTRTVPLGHHAIAANGLRCGFSQSPSGPAILSTVSDSQGKQGVEVAAGSVARREATVAISCWSPRMMRSPRSLRSFVMMWSSTANGPQQSRRRCEVGWDSFALLGTGVAISCF